MELGSSHHIFTNKYTNYRVLKDVDKDIRLLSKLATKEQVLGEYGAQNRSVHLVPEDSSLGATMQLPLEVECRKKSIISIDCALSPIKFNNKLISWYKGIYVLTHLFNKTLAFSA